MAPETALSLLYLFAGLNPKSTQQLRRPTIVVAFAAIFGSVHVGARRVTDSFQLDNPSLELGIVHIGETILNGLVQPSQFGLRVRGLLSQLGNPTLRASSALLPALKQASE